MCDIINFQLKQGFSWNTYSIAPSNRCACSALAVPLLTVLYKYMDFKMGSYCQPDECELVLMPLDVAVMMWAVL